MHPPSAVIFDLDGTLVDSVPDMHAALNVTLAAFERQPLDLQTTLSFVGNGAAVLVKRALEATGGASTPKPDLVLERFLREYKTQGVQLSRIYPGVLECLSDLRSAGIALGLCTNKPQRPTEDICDALNLTQFFEVMIGATKDRPRKPDPSPLNAAMAGLGTNASQCLFVGDSVVDHATAAAAGVPLVLFTSGYMNGQIDAPDPEIQFSDWRHGWWRTLID